MCWRLTVYKYNCNWKIVANRYFQWSRKIVQEAFHECYHSLVVLSTSCAICYFFGKKCGQLACFCSYLISTVCDWQLGADCGQGWLKSLIWRPKKKKWDSCSSSSSRLSRPHRTTGVAWKINRKVCFWSTDFRKILFWSLTAEPALWATTCLGLVKETVLLINHIGLPRYYIFTHSISRYRQISADTMSYMNAEISMHWISANTIIKLIITLRNINTFITYIVVWSAFYWKF